MDIVVQVRCSRCKHVRKQWDKDFWEVNREIELVPATLKEYAEAICEKCGQQGMSIWIDVP